MWNGKNETERKEEGKTTMMKKKPEFFSSPFPPFFPFSGLASLFFFVVFLPASFIFAHVTREHVKMEDSFCVQEELELPYGKFNSNAPRGWLTLVFLRAKVSTARASQQLVAKRVHSITIVKNSTLVRRHGTKNILSSFNLNKTFFSSLLQRLHHIHSQNTLNENHMNQIRRPGTIFYASSKGMSDE